MYKTIKDIATELEVSKTAVRKKIRELEIENHIKKNGNQFLINENQEKAIKSMFSKEKNGNKKKESEKNGKLNGNLNEKENDKNVRILDFMAVELKEKNKQIQRLQEENERVLGVNQSLIELNKNLIELNRSLMDLTASLESSLKGSQMLHAGTMQQNFIEQQEKVQTKRKWWKVWE